MGKLGVAGVAVFSAVLSALVPSEARAQDFGQSWIDRITHSQEQERGPLTAKPFNLSAAAGVGYAYDSNLFLAPTGAGKVSDSIITPFIKADLSYGEAKFDLEASLLANGKIYLNTTSADDDEERFMIRARQTASRWNFEITEIFQNVSDPNGLLFNARVSRIISNTIPKVAFDINRSWSIELGMNYQVVRFDDLPTGTAQDNNNFTLDAAVVYRTPWGFDLVAQFGYQNVGYVADQTIGGAPDFVGYYYRVGFRGQLIERLTLETLVGWATARTDYFIASGNNISTGTVRVDVNLRYEVTERFNLYLDFNRSFAFEGYGDPYQILNTAAVIAMLDLTEQFKAAARVQYDRSDSALNVHRTYYSGSVTAEYKPTAHLIVDVGATFRGGRVSNLSAFSFTDFILSAGIALGW